MNEIDFYNMKCLERKIIGTEGLETFYIIKVPGGWIYERCSPNGNSCTFIPFVNRAYTGCK